MTRESIKSNIHPEVLYVPKQTVYSEDCNIELSVYEIQALGKEFVIALGNPKYTHSARGVIFVPIYFVPSDTHSPKIQIGVYEYEKDRAIALLDKDGDLNIHELVPIFFHGPIPFFLPFPPNLLNILQNPRLNRRKMTRRKKVKKKPRAPMIRHPPKTKMYFVCPRPVPRTPSPLLLKKQTFP